MLPNPTMMEDVARWQAGTHVRIRLDAYARNLARLRAYAPTDAGLMAIVKADAYGHGLAMCGLAAEATGAEWLGVARIQEGLRLRAAGVTLPVLVLGPPNLAELRLAVAAGLTLAVGAEHALQAVIALATEGVRANVHLKVDTGMRRYGFTSAEVADAAQKLVAAGVSIDGVFTHFASADDLDPTPTEEALADFAVARNNLRAVGVEPRWAHAANSAGLLTGFTADTTMVRSGIATYGLSPSPEVPVPDAFEPIAEVWSTVERRFVVQPGQGVTYNHTWIAQEPTDAGAVPVGYADGFPRNLANKGWLVVDGVRAPILGRVCMDQTVAQVPAGTTAGAAVQVTGQAPAMSFAEIGTLAGTNNYEVATRMMARMPRVYLVGEQPLGWEHLLLGEATYPTVAELRSALHSINATTVGASATT